jgi:hypothetical protein
MLKPTSDQPDSPNYRSSAMVAVSRCLRRLTLLSFAMAVLMTVVCHAQQGTLTDDERTDGGKPIAPLSVASPEKPQPEQTRRPPVAPKPLQKVEP